MFFHQRGDKNQPSYTVAGIFEGSTMKLAACRCSENDQFARRKGRIIAQGRLNCTKSEVCERWTTTIGYGTTNPAEVGKTFLEYARKLIVRVEETVQSDRVKLGKVKQAEQPVA